MGSHSVRDAGSNGARYSSDVATRDLDVGLDGAAIELLAEVPAQRLRGDSVNGPRNFPNSGL